MRAWVEPDDDDVPVLTVLVMENGAVVDGYFKASYPKKWHLELNDIPHE